MFIRTLLAVFLSAAPALAQVSAPTTGTAQLPLASGTVPGLVMPDLTCFTVNSATARMTLNPACETGNGTAPTFLNSCPSMIGDGVTLNGAAFQTCVNTIEKGVLDLPAGHFIVDSTVTIPDAIRIRCASVGATTIDSGGRDITLLHFTGGTRPGLENCFVIGDMAATASKVVVIVDFNIPVVFQHNYIWGGSWALNTSGIDGVYFDNFYNGASNVGGDVWSQGSNWWIREKFDDGGQFHYYAFYQYALPNGQVPENRFVESDFSGDFDYSLVINDTTHQAMTFLTNSVTPLPIVISGAKATSFSGHTFAAAIQSPFDGAIGITGSFSYAPISIAGASCAGNLGGISC